MALATLNKGAVSLAAANWSDATGFADNATLQIAHNFGPITDASLDQSGLTTGIDYLDILAGAVGTIGGAGNSLLVDADSAATDFVRNMGAVALWLAAGGGSTLIQNFHAGGRSSNWLTGGSFTNVTQNGGSLNVDAQAIIVTLLVASAGSSTVEYNATGITGIHLTGGVHRIRRGYTNLFVGGTAQVFDEREDGTGATVTVYGGSYFPVFGNVTNVYGYGGTIDQRLAKEHIDFGSSLLQVSGANLIRSGLCDNTNLTTPSAWLNGGEPV